MFDDILTNSSLNNYENLKFEMCNTDVFNCASENKSFMDRFHESLNCDLVNVCKASPMNLHIKFVYPNERLRMELFCLILVEVHKFTEN